MKIYINLCSQLFCKVLFSFLEIVMELEPGTFYHEDPGISSPSVADSATSKHQTLVNPKKGNSGGIYDIFI